MQYFAFGRFTPFLSVILVSAPEVAPLASFVANDVSKFATTFVSFDAMV
jgi:hypothetical protein